MRAASDNASDSNHGRGRKGAKEDIVERMELFSAAVNNSLRQMIRLGGTCWPDASYAKKMVKLSTLQGDHSACAKPPVDFKSKVPL